MNMDGLDVFPLRRNPGTKMVRTKPSIDSFASFWEPYPKSKADLKALESANELWGEDDEIIELKKRPSNCLSPFSFAGREFKPRIKAEMKQELKSFVRAQCKPVIVSINGIFDPIPIEEDEKVEKKDTQRNKSFYASTELNATKKLKTLAHRYGVRGKMPRSAFLQCFSENFLTPEVLKSLSKDDDTPPPPAAFIHYVDDRHLPPIKKTEAEIEVQKMFESSDLGKHLNKTEIETVIPSAFVKRLERFVAEEIERLHCSQTVLEMATLFERIQKNKLNFSEFRGSLKPGDILKDIQRNLKKFHEPERKLTARLEVYKSAFRIFMCHFKNLRPTLAKIKFSYDYVLYRKNTELQRILQLRRDYFQFESKFDSQVAKVTQEGYTRFATAEKTRFLLLRHTDKQDSLIRTISSILERLENVCQEEVDLRSKAMRDRKNLIIELNELRLRVAEQNVDTDFQDEIELDFDLDHEEEEEVEHEVKHYEGEIEIDLKSHDTEYLRRTLNTVREEITRFHKRIMTLEADYTDVVPKEECETAQAEIEELRNNYQVLSKEKRELEEKVKASREELNKMIDGENAKNPDYIPSKPVTNEQSTSEKVGEQKEGDNENEKSEDKKDDMEETKVNETNESKTSARTEDTEDGRKSSRKKSKVSPRKKSNIKKKK